MSDVDIDSADFDSMPDSVPNFESDSRSESEDSSDISAYQPSSVDLDNDFGETTCGVRSSSPRTTTGVRSSSSKTTCDQPAFVNQGQIRKRKFRMLDEDNGVRIKIIPCQKKLFQTRLTETHKLGDDFFIPNRAQLMLNFLKRHGNKLAKEKSGPTRRFPTTLALVQHAINHQLV